MSIVLAVICLILTVLSMEYDYLNVIIFVYACFNFTGESTYWAGFELGIAFISMFTVVPPF